MKILMVNVVCGIRSTGRICTDIARELEKQGHEVKIAYGRECVPEQFGKYAVRIGTNLDVKMHGLKARLFDKAGFGSRHVTKRFVSWIEQYNPDVIHLHNIHGYYINVEILFQYLKKSGKKIIWTLHDCWSFTGHCTYFDYVKCNKWAQVCHQCEQKKEYPSCFGISATRRNYFIKKKLFTNVPNMTLVTPSAWLAKLISTSYMKEYPINVINNGIDTNVFKPVYTDVKEKNGISNKTVILGVAAIWDRRKGLNFLLDLAEKLDDTYVVVVIGVTEEQKKLLPHNVYGVTRTNSVKELVEWYSAAKVFVNPTLEDNYPTTNLESIACGTPVITFDTGGSSESAQIYGKVVEKNTNAIYEAIVENMYQKNEANIDVLYMVKKYIELYIKKE